MQVKGILLGALTILVAAVVASLGANSQGVVVVRRPQAASAPQALPRRQCGS